MFQNKKYELLEKIKDISSLANIHYIRQKEPLGLGDAILKAEKHIGTEPFAVLLGDDIIVNKKSAMEQLIECYESVDCSVIGLEEVPLEMVSKYGIVGVEQQEDLFLVKNLVEKPEKEKVNPGYNGEIQLTDALNLLLESQKIYGKKIEGKRYDIGDQLSYV